ncbi:MAG TPA: hypothetical protein DDX29_12135 [Clostridiales bacterium]|nr:hypothetical protein [Clostridiales bacterium]
MTGMPFSRINIGDVFESPLAWTGSKMVYIVVDKDKDSKMIEVMSSYQHPALPKTFWKKYTDRLFNKRIVIGKAD